MPRRPKPGKTYRDPFYGWDPKKIDLFYKALENPGKTFKVPHKKDPTFGDAPIEHFVSKDGELVEHYYLSPTASRADRRWLDKDGRTMRHAMNDINLRMALLEASASVKNKTLADEILAAYLAIAMSMPEALDLLGFKPGTSPSPDEIKRAYKRAAFDLHPDRGGDPAKMVQVNIAKDILLGKQRAKPVYTPKQSQPAPKQKPWTPPKETIVSFEEAVRSANVPKADWKFMTDTSSDGWFGDESTDRRYAYIVYGRTDLHHLFVSVFNHVQKDYFIGGVRNSDITTVKVHKYPLGNPLPKLAPKAIREIWKKDFHGVKNYNAKVYLMDLKTPMPLMEKNIDQAIRGTKVAFKVAMQNLGEDVPSTWKGKVDIILKLYRDKRIEDRSKYSSLSYGAELIINGKSYKLSETSGVQLSNASWYDLVFKPKYYYDDSKKNLTKMRGPKKEKMFNFLLKVLQRNNEPAEVIQAVEKAMEQK